MSRQARLAGPERQHSVAGAYALQLFLATVGVTAVSALVGWWLAVLLTFGGAFSERVENTLF